MYAFSTFLSFKLLFLNYWIGMVENMGVYNSNRQVRRTKSFMKKALILLMKKKQYRKITVKEIISVADYNKTTFYRHYINKDNLFEELKTDMINGFIEAFRHPYKNANEIFVDNKIAENIIIFNHIKENKEFYSLFNHPKNISEINQLYIETIFTILKTDIIHNKRGQTIDDELFLTFRTYGIWGLILHWIQTDYNKTVDQMSEQLINILYCNLSSKLKVNHNDIIKPL